MNPCKHLCQTSKQLRPLPITLDDIQPEDVIFYSRLLGIDLYREHHLLGIAVFGLLCSLPKDWIACEDRRGRVYYYNLKNNNSTWINPNDIELQSLVNRIRREPTMNNRLNRKSLLQDLIPEEVEEESVSEIDFKNDSSDSKSSESHDQLNLNGNQPTGTVVPFNQEKVSQTNASIVHLSPKKVKEDNSLQESIKNNNNTTLTDEYEDDFEPVSIEDIASQNVVQHNHDTKNHNTVSDEYLERIQVQVKNCETNLSQAMRQMGRELERTIQLKHETAPSDSTRIDLHKEIESLSATVRTIHANFLQKQTQSTELFQQTNDAVSRIDSTIDRNVNVSQKVLENVRALTETVANQGQNFQKIENNFSALRQQATQTVSLDSQLQYLNKQIDHLLKNNQELLYTVQSKATQESIVSEPDLSEFHSKFTILEQKVDNVLKVLSDVKSSSDRDSIGPATIVRTNEQTQTEPFINTVPTNIPFNSTVSDTLRKCIRELNAALTDDIQANKQSSTESSSNESATLIPVRYNHSKQHHRHDIPFRRQEYHHSRSKSLNERRKRQSKRYHTSTLNDSAKLQDNMDKIHERSHSLMSLIHQTNKQLSRELDNIRNLKKFDPIPTVRLPSSERLHKPNPDSIVILQNLKQLRGKVNDRIDRLSQAIERQKISDV